MPRTPKFTKTVRAGVATAIAAVCAAALCALPGAAGAASSFYRYDGTKALASYQPGAVLKTRTVAYHLLGIATPLSATQVLYRSTNARGQAIAAVTSVLRIPGLADGSKVAGYQSFYDSLNPEDGPSRAIAGDEQMPGIGDVEPLLIAPLLLAGYDVVVTDTEGPTADFAAGPEYGTVTLDALRAVSATGATGIKPTAKIGLIGYSGGAIATNWAAALAPSYAPDVNRRLVGAAEGGVLVDPDHNLHYIDGSQVWAGVLPMAIIGVARAYDIDLLQYMSDYGRQVYAKLEHAGIASALGAYSGLTWAKLAKPEYSSPESVPPFVTYVNKLNLGQQPSPTVPMFIGQGTNGVLEGTNGVGVGDGVMVAGDVRALARQYCASGTKVTFRQYDLTSHFTTVALWAPEAYAWLINSFTSTPGQNCSTIAPGNSLAPVAVSR